MPNEKDTPLWRIAQKRASFRRNLYSYVVVNCFFWAIWWFTYGSTHGLKGYPWPVWIMLAWGIALAFQYFNAYHGNKEELAEKEYERLKKNKEL